MFFRCFAHIVNLICKAMLEEAAGNVPELSPVKRLKSVISNVCVLFFFTQFIFNLHDLDTIIITQMWSVLQYHEGFRDEASTINPRCRDKVVICLSDDRLCDYLKRDMF